MNIYFLLTIITLLLSSISLQGEKQTDANDTEFWALLVAVAEYADNPNENRPLMLDEVDDFHELLLSSPIWQEDHIKVIKTEDATTQNILKGLKWLDDQEDKNDMSLFYITTHGFPLGYEIPPYDEEDGTDEALASYWFFAYPYPTTIISDDEINFMLNRLESQGVCMIVDSCYAGGFNDPPDWNQQNIISTQEQKDKESAISEWIHGFGREVSAQNRVVVMASCEDELSYSGGFAPYIIDAMKGYGDTNKDGIISAEEAFYYAEPRTIRQSPTIFDNYPGEFPLIIMDESDEESTIKSNNPDQTKSEFLFTGNERVYGYITDSDTNNPIVNATVEITIGDYWDGTRNTTTTDKSGYYDFNVEPGNMRIFVSHIGHLNGRTERFSVQENEQVWKNISLNSMPEETAMIYGYLKDSDSLDPIKECNITVEWGSHWEGYFNHTQTDNNGFFKINVAAGEIELSFEHHDYIPNYSDEYQIQEAENVWMNVTLKRRLEENSVMCGFITDDETGQLINDATIYIEWQDTEENYLQYMTESDAFGFFSIALSPGETYLTVIAQDYHDEYTGRNDAFEQQTTWMNVSLEPGVIQLDMLKPLNALYINNNRVIPYQRCIILGSIDIEASIHDFYYRDRDDDVDRVEFFLDDELVETVFSPPFIWEWNQKSFGNHMIKIIAYDDNDFSVIAERPVMRIG